MSGLAPAIRGRQRGVGIHPTGRAIAGAVPPWSVAQRAPAQVVSAPASESSICLCMMVRDEPAARARWVVRRLARAGRRRLGRGTRSLVSAALAAAAFAVVGAVNARPAAAYVYWANRDANSIGRANLDGKGVNQRFITRAISPRGVALDRSHIYWVSAPFGGGGTIGRANLTPSQIKPHFVGGDIAPNGIAVGAGHIYFTDFSDLIGRVNLDGSGLEPSFITESVFNPEGIAVAGGHIYFADANGVKRASLDGVVDLTLTGAEATGVAVYGSHVYWVGAGGGVRSGTIGRARLDGSDVRPYFIRGLSDPLWVAVDAGHIYFTDLYGAGETIGRANLDGSHVDERFIRGLQGAEGLAVDRGGPAPKRRCRIVLRRVHGKNHRVQVCA